MHKQTALIHDPKATPMDINTMQPPVYHASTIIFDSTKSLFNRHWTDRYDYSYGTHGTPTTYLLADQIARLEGGQHCLLTPSGLSAISLVNTALLTTGDEVWIPDNAYSPNLAYLQQLQSSYGISIKIYQPQDIDSFMPSKACKLLWLEAAGSITLEFPNLPAFIRKAHQHGAWVTLDNTWGAAVAFCPFAIDTLAVDISVHALTKYPSGGGDVLMGSIVSRDNKLHQRLLQTHSVLGLSVSGDDCARIYRSLPNLQLRYQQQSATAQQLMHWLKNQPQFSQVLHPANPDSAGHDAWQKLCPSGLSSGLVSVVFDKRYRWADVCHFCDALRLFQLGFSWGGATSLVMLYDIKKIRSLPQTHLQGDYVVRFSVGLEHIDDLTADIAAALLVLNYDEKAAQP